MIRRLITNLSRLFAVLAAGCLLLLMLGITLSVLVRKATGSEIPGVVESGELILVGGAYLGMAWTYRTGSHVSMDLVTERLSPILQAVVTALSTLLLLGMLVWLFVATADSALHSFQADEYRYGTIRFPVWPARLFIPLGLAAMAAEVAVDVWQKVRSILRRDFAGAAGPADPEAVPVSSF